MSQEQWNEKKRADRYKEFAPPVIENFNKPETSKRTNAPPELSEDDINNYLQARRSEKSLKFTSKLEFKRKNYDASMTSNDEDSLPAKVSKDDTSKIPLLEVSNEDLEKSIAAGLRFLRDQSDKGEPKNKNSWATRKEY